MIAATLTAVVVARHAQLAAGLDSVAAIAILAGIVGMITGIGGYLTTRSEVRTKADGGYVDRNLAAMQALIDRQATELERCNKECAECRQRIQTLEAATR